jgi:hypothetical protein
LPRTESAVRTDRRRTDGIVGEELSEWMYGSSTGERVGAVNRRRQAAETGKRQFIIASSTSG